MHRNGAALAPAREPDAAVGPAPYSSFHRPQWRITPERAEAWVRHRFRSTRGLASVRALQSDEFALLLSDLDYYSSWRRRHQLGLGPAPPPPHEYLTPGREEWGSLADLVNELYPKAGAAMGCPTNEEEDVYPESDTDDAEDRSERRKSRGSRRRHSYRHST